MKNLQGRDLLWGAPTHKTAGPFDHAMSRGKIETFISASILSIFMNMDKCWCCKFIVANLENLKYEIQKKIVSCFIGVT